jgi:TRAP-type C4-dicarboxylate transport system permease small subunit
MTTAVIQIIDRAVGQALRLIAMACLVGLFALLFANVVIRLFELASIAWFDEVVQALFAWMVFIGAAALWRENEHFRVDWLEQQLSGTGAGRLLGLIVQFLCLAFLSIMTWKGYDFTVRANAVTPIMRIPVAIVYVVIPISGAIMSVYTVANMWAATKALASPHRAPFSNP